LFRFCAKLIISSFLVFVQQKKPFGAFVEIILKVNDSIMYKGSAKED